MARSSRSTGRTLGIIFAGTIIVLLTAAAFLYLAYPLFVKAPGAPSTPAPVGLTLQQFFTGAGITTGKIDIANPSDLSKPLESAITSTTSFYQSSGFYSPGTSLWIHGYVTGDYDNVQTYTVPASVSVVSSSQVYVLGTMTLDKRSTAVSETLTNPDGSVTTSSDIGVGAAVGTYTATSKTSVFDLTARATTVSSAYGYPMPWVSSSFAQLNLVAVQWIGFNKNTIVSSDITGNGWTPINSPPTGTLVFYKVLAEIDTPTSGSIGSKSSTVTVNTSPMAGGSTLQFAVWTTDLQNTADLPFGVADGAPAAYGASSAVGLATTYGKGYSSTMGAGIFLVANLVISLTITTF